MAVGQLYFCYPASYLATAVQSLLFCCLNVTSKHQNISVTSQLSQVMVSFLSLITAPSTFSNIIFFLFAVHSLNIWSSFSLFLKSAWEIHVFLDLYVYTFLPDLASRGQCRNKSSGHNCVRSFILSQEYSGRFSSFFFPLALTMNVLNPVERFRLVYITK